MIEVLAVLAIIAWLWVGYQGFVQSWTRDHDFTTKERSFALVIAFCGPFTWLIGLFVHPPKTLRNRREHVIKRRKA